MEHNNRSTKIKSYLGLALLGLLLYLLLSLIFWRERVFMLDASFQSFSIVAAKDWAFQVERYGAALVQGLPLLLTKWGASLQNILISYSLSFTLYPLLLFGILWKTKRTTFALALALFFLLIMTHTFFWIQSELIQASALAIFTVGLGSNDDWKWWIRIPLVLLLVVLTIYTHPLGIAPLLFGWVITAFGAGGSLNNKNLFSFLGMGALSVGMFLLIQFKLKTGAYDQTAMEMVTAVPEHLPDFFTLPAFNRFLSQILWPYPFIPILLIGTIWWYASRKQWWRLITFSGAFALWLIIVLCTWWYGAELFYIESYYLVLGVFLALPLALDILPALPKRSGLIGLGLLLVFRMVAIVTVGQLYLERRQQLDTYITQMRAEPGQRFVIKKDRIDRRLFEMTWGIPYATTMRSALDGPDQVTTLITYKDEVPEHVRVFEKNAMPTPWGPFKYDWFNGREYFNFTDTLRIEELPIPTE